MHLHQVGDTEAYREVIRETCSHTDCRIKKPLEAAAKRSYRKGPPVPFGTWEVLEGALRRGAAGNADYGYFSVLKPGAGFVPPLKGQTAWSADRSVVFGFMT